MPASQAVTETIILHLKKDVNLENVASSTSADTSPAVQVFVQLTNTVKAQQGFIRQFWGHQVEDQHIFVWSIVYTRFTSDPSAALAAPVTEVAFFTVPNDAREIAKTMIEDQPITSTHPVITVGKSSGGATGWVFNTKNAGDAAPDGESIALHGVFGYANVDDHIKWRETPEHAQVIEDIGQSPLANLGLGNAIMPGGNIFVPDSSMFHVKFRAGV